LIRPLLFHFIIVQLSIIASAQDVIVHITAQFQNAAISSDSLLVENLSNGSSVKLRELPGEVTTYDINLTKGKILNGITDPARPAFGFFLYGNRPGQLQVKARLKASIQIGLTFIDLTGRPVFAYSTECPSGVSVITLLPGSTKSGILLVEGGGFKQSFKVTGSRDDIPETSFSLKSVDNPDNDWGQSIKQTTYPGEFIFIPGDSVRFTLYRSEFYPGFSESIPTQGDSIKIYLSKPCPGTAFVSDFDGNVYSTVQIGDQCWMRVNLNTTHYSDGTGLIDGTGAGPLDPGNDTRYWFNYDDNPLLNGCYGRLYTYFAATKGISGNEQMVIQGVCPAGWHLPSDEEWKTLELFLGMSLVEADRSQAWRGTTEGGKLKEPGLSHWINANYRATNESGFMALPGGHREYYTGAFVSIHEMGYWWSSTLNWSGNATSRWLVKWRSTIYRSLQGYITEANAVRCLKD